MGTSTLALDHHELGQVLYTQVRAYTDICAPQVPCDMPGNARGYKYPTGVDSRLTLLEVGEREDSPVTFCQQIKGKLEGNARLTQKVCTALSWVEDACYLDNVIMKQHSAQLVAAECNGASMSLVHDKAENVTLQQHLPSP